MTEEIQFDDRLLWVGVAVAAAVYVYVMLQTWSAGALTVGGAVLWVLLAAGFGVMALIAVSICLTPVAWFLRSRVVGGMTTEQALKQTTRYAVRATLFAAGVTLCAAVFSLATHKAAVVLPGWAEVVLGVAWIVLVTSLGARFVMAGNRRRRQIPIVDLSPGRDLQP